MFLFVVFVLYQLDRKITVKIHRQNLFIVQTKNKQKLSLSAVVICDSRDVSVVDLSGSGFISAVSE